MLTYLKKLGSGLLFAGAAIGVSHLVQSTQAEAEFGFGLLQALLLCNFFKYPFFLFGTKYTHATGETLLDDYKRIGSYVLTIHLAISLVTIFTIQAAVTIVTSGLAVKLFGMTSHLTLWSYIITISCLLILIIGRYRLLGNLIKVIILVLVFQQLQQYFSPACIHMLVLRQHNSYHQNLKISFSLQPSWAGCQPRLIRQYANQYGPK